MKKRIMVKLILRSLLLNVILAVVGELVLYFLLPKFWFAFYPIVLLFFFVMAMIIFFTLHYYVLAKGTGNIVITYFIARFYKMLMTLLFIWLYATCIHDQMIVFALSVIVAYISNLVYETSVMTIYVKKGIKSK
jgi:hypothetical protein